MNLTVAQIFSDDDIGESDNEQPTPRPSKRIKNQKGEYQSEEQIECTALGLKHRRALRALSKVPGVELSERNALVEQQNVETEAFRRRYQRRTDNEIDAEEAAEIKEERLLQQRQVSKHFRSKLSKYGLVEFKGRSKPHSSDETLPPSTAAKRIPKLADQKRPTRKNDALEIPQGDIEIARTIDADGVARLEELTKQEVEDLFGGELVSRGLPQPSSDSSPQPIAIKVGPKKAAPKFVSRSAAKQLAHRSYTGPSVLKAAEPARKKQKLSSTQAAALSDSIAATATSSAADLALIVAPALKRKAKPSKPFKFAPSATVASTAAVTQSKSAKQSQSTAAAAATGADFLALPSGTIHIESNLELTQKELKEAVGLREALLKQIITARQGKQIYQSQAKTIQQDSYGLALHRAGRLTHPTKIRALVKRLSDLDCDPKSGALFVRYFTA